MISPVLNILLIIISLFVLVAISIMARKRLLLLRYLLLWYLLALLGMVFVIFPQPLIAMAHLLGFEAASNFVFLVLILYLLLQSMYCTAILSSHSRKLTRLTQELALLRHELEEKRGTQSGINEGTDDLRESELKR